METQIQFPKIQFGGENPTLDDYNNYYWNEGETREVEFYPGKTTPVTVIDASDPNLLEKLMSLSDDMYVSADFEWVTNVKSSNIIELFQYSSSKGVIIVTGNKDCGANAIKEFHERVNIIGKGMVCDNIKLRKFFGKPPPMEDIEKTRLQPNKIPINFEKMSNIFNGNSCAVFKDHKVQMSNWSKRPLTIKQVLYSAHDAYSVFLVYREILDFYGKYCSKRKNAQNSDKNTAFKIIERKIIDEEPPEIVNLEKGKIPYSKQLSLKQLYFIKMSKNNKNFASDDAQFLNSENDQLLEIIFPDKKRKKRKSEKIEKIKNIFATIDLIANGCIIKGKSDFYCVSCCKMLRSFEGIVEHCTSKHIPKENVPIISYDLKQLALKYFNAISMVDCPISLTYPDLEFESVTNRIRVNKESNKTVVYICKSCDKQFENIDELKNHCWLDHVDQLNELFGLKVQPDYFDNQGYFIINDLQLATITKENNIKCKICSQIFEDPTSFFFHTFFKHFNFRIVSSKDASAWQLNVKKLPSIPPFIKENILKQLKKYDFKMFNKDENKCNDCICSFENDYHMFEHMINNHLIFYPK